MSIDISDFNPGIVPVGPRVLVYPEPVEMTTKGGIALPTMFTDREEMQQMKAVVIDLGLEAFSDVVENWCDLGDEVVIAKYSGVMWTGTDGLKYRILNDADIVARLESDDPLDQVCESMGIDSNEDFGNV